MDFHTLTARVGAVSDRYAERHGIERDSAWFMLKLHEEVGELTEAFLAMSGGTRTKGRTPEEMAAGFRSELADVFCQLLLLADHHDVDLLAEVDAKWSSRLREGTEAPGEG
ncbi:pyrophosphatase [Nocardiopsis sp. N85]|uniref:pyrophosphatase n=1 Tax=Nocardiopsis sp. N85 TaxID=3029400 RepID=UPI00237F1A11|nr:pyrophosphatase [Nocardiopsis sp. N85]MDE3724857.1 pyrophosphatase [Nocardiopsis sp. N85]